MCAACSGTGAPRNRTSCGKIIGAAEGNKELKDRNGGFGAYDVPFLGPTGARAAKDVTDNEVGPRCRSHPYYPRTNP